MKVHIGPYRSELISVRRLELKYECWRRPGECYLPEEEYTWYDNIVFEAFDRLSYLLRPINRWWQNRERKVDVRIDGYDVWSADHTLALIIAPVLRKLRDEKHGYPQVECEDVPEDLRWIADEGSMEKYGPEVDAKRVARWEWVLGEMIWAFEQHAAEDDEDQFYHNRDQLEMKIEKIEGKKYSELKFNDQRDPTMPKYWVDREAIKAHNERKDNGRRLFAKYYRCLWD